MSLFGPSRPKGITEEEFRYIKGELAHAPLGHSGEALHDHQIEEILARLKLLLNPDTAIEIKNNWRQVDQNEVAELESQFSSDKSLHITPEQKAHIAQVLQKYIDIDKHPSLF